eukprot:CAMPEP_0182447070 /NCGR_PEP_ID=MMETSP1172-20130603/11039_1 /TAXON_ID=708627 /ORGANISM="Timspurckia oligopyrenoides, Strain CCMP3278" /LENGTH=320 /DNA_ID=CAMNT_0024643351 /DNA_START=31 /DNA_END=993 /DNA_ORIENTATION=-
MGSIDSEGNVIGVEGGTVIQNESGDELRKAEVIESIERLGMLLQAGQSALLCGNMEHSRILCDGGLELYAEIAVKYSQFISPRPSQTANALRAWLLLLSGHVFLQESKVDSALTAYKFVWSLCKMEVESDDEDDRRESTSVQDNADSKKGSIDALAGFGIDQSEKDHLEFEAVVGVGEVMMRTDGQALAVNTFQGAFNVAKVRHDLQGMSFASMSTARALSKSGAGSDKVCEQIGLGVKYGRELVDSERNRSEKRDVLEKGALKYLFNVCIEAAELYVQNGMIDEAKECVSTAVEVGPNHSEAIRDIQSLIQQAQTNKHI